MAIELEEFYNKVLNKEYIDPDSFNETEFYALVELIKLEHFAEKAAFLRFLEMNQKARGMFQQTLEADQAVSTLSSRLSLEDFPTATSLAATAEEKVMPAEHIKLITWKHRDKNEKIKEPYQISRDEAVKAKLHDLVANAHVLDFIRNAPLTAATLMPEYLLNIMQQVPQVAVLVAVNKQKHRFEFIIKFLQDNPHELHALLAKNDADLPANYHEILFQFAAQHLIFDSAFLRTIADPKNENENTALAQARYHINKFLFTSRDLPFPVELIDLFKNRPLILIDLLKNASPKQQLNLLRNIPQPIQFFTHLAENSRAARDFIHDKIDLIAPLLAEQVRVDTGSAQQFKQFWSKEFAPNFVLENSLSQKFSTLLDENQEAPFAPNSPTMRLLKHAELRPYMFKNISSNNSSTANTDLVNARKKLANIQNLPRHLLDLSKRKETVSTAEAYEIISNPALYKKIRPTLSIWQRLAHYLFNSYAEEMRLLDEWGDDALTNEKLGALNPIFLGTKANNLSQAESTVAERMPHLLGGSRPADFKREQCTATVQHFPPVLKNSDPASPTTAASSGAPQPASAGDMLQNADRIPTPGSPGP